MLVLSRKSGEAIMLGDDIKIVIVETRSDKVRVGIEAPPEMPVHRQEVYEAIQREMQEQGGLPQEAESPQAEEAQGDKA